MFECLFNDKDVRALLKLRGQCGYNDTNKRKFARLSRKLMQALADALQLTDFEVRYNSGGIAVSGEATLHGQRLYVQVTDNTDLGILVRTCKGRKDYSGGPNRWFAWTALESNGLSGLASFAEVVVTGR